jgi:hypothetical protein
MSQPPSQPPRPRILHSRTESQSYVDAATEAESRPMQFDPNVRSHYIRQMLELIQPMVARGASEEEIKAQTGDFAENYPNFFKKLMAKEDLQPIYGMIHMLDRMGAGQINQHQASIAVGTNLYKKYIEPNLRRSGQPN